MVLFSPNGMPQAKKKNSPGFNILQAQGGPPTVSTLNPLTPQPMSSADRNTAYKNSLKAASEAQATGNANYNPNTGTVEPFKFKPWAKDKSNELVQTGTSEAQNFRFDLPESGFNQAQGGLFNLSNQLIGAMGDSQQDRDSAQQELAQLQRQALSPELDPQQRQYFQDRADARRAELETRFSEGGDIANLFARQKAADTASLANTGVLDSTTGAQSMARRDTDLAALYNQLLGGAEETSRAEQLGERTRIGETATQFGGLQGGQATAAGQLGQGYGQLGLQGFGAAGELGLKNQEQQGQFQLAETGQRLLGNQLQLQNIQSLLNQRLNRNQARKQAEMQQELFDKYMNPGFNWLGGFGNILSPQGAGGFIQGGMQ